jgi:hypothetical protein
LHEVEDSKITKFSWQGSEIKANFCDEGHLASESIDENESLSELAAHRSESHLATIQFLHIFYASTLSLKFYLTVDKKSDTNL